VSHVQPSSKCSVTFAGHLPPSSHKIHTGVLNYPEAVAQLIQLTVSPHQCLCEEVVYALGTLLLCENSQYKSFEFERLLTF